MNESGSDSMVGRKGKAGGQDGRRSRGRRTSVRDGGSTLTVSNSGLEVWLYDDANRETIRRGDASDPGFGGMPPGFEQATRQGLVVGYSLYQDDDVSVAVHVGPPLTEDELSVARWLEPQRAFLRLPSGRLCIESNDASRIGPEEPMQKGAVVEVPAGDYGLTLYRIDHEALDREGLAWQGPQEMIVLTPGGNADDAADYLLPFEPRRDNAWVGSWSVRGKSADALVWFSDYWDTFILNIDSAAVSALGLAPGTYFRTRVPVAGITLVSVFGTSWDQAKRLPPPAGVELDEYGYGALSPMADWNGAEALFCRRDKTATRVEDEHHNVWIPAVVEVLDAQPETAPAGKWTPAKLRTKGYFDSGFLALVLSDLLPEVADLDELELPAALDMIDEQLGAVGLAPQGDSAWTERVGAHTIEATFRLYAGLPDRFAAILAGDGIFEFVFLSELDDGGWIATGLADEIERWITSRGRDGLPVPHPRIRLESIDDSVPAILTAHETALDEADAAAAPAPASMEDAVAALERFLTLAFAADQS